MKTRQNAPRRYWRHARNPVLTGAACLFLAYVAFLSGYRRGHHDYVLAALSLLVGAVQLTRGAVLLWRIRPRARPALGRVPPVGWALPETPADDAA